MLQLTPGEARSLRSQIAPLKKRARGGHRKYLPYAFTEQSVAEMKQAISSLSDRVQDLERTVDDFNGRQ